MRALASPAKQHLKGSLFFNRIYVERKNRLLWHKGRLQSRPWVNVCSRLVHKKAERVIRSILSVLLA